MESLSPLVCFVVFSRVALLVIFVAPLGARKDAFLFFSIVFLRGPWWFCLFVTVVPPRGLSRNLVLFFRFRFSSTPLFPYPPPLCVSPRPDLVSRFSFFRLHPPEGSPRFFFLCSLTIFFEPRSPPPAEFRCRTRPQPFATLHFQFF